LKFAQDFKDPLREGTVSAVFGHSPLPAEVVLNIPALWNDPEFQQAVEAYSQGGQPNASALQHFNARQSEVILNCPLRADEIEGFCGRSSPFELLCDSAEFRKRRLGRRFGGGWSTGESSRNNLCG
jgi:hypothetical protein